MILSLASRLPERTTQKKSKSPLILLHFFLFFYSLQGTTRLFSLPLVRNCKHSHAINRPINWKRKTCFNRFKNLSIQFYFNKNSRYRFIYNLFSIRFLCLSILFNCSFVESCVVINSKINKLQIHNYRFYGQISPSVS